MVPDPREYKGMGIIRVTMKLLGMTWAEPGFMQRGGGIK